MECKACNCSVKVRHIRQVKHGVASKNNTNYNIIDFPLDFFLFRYTVAFSYLIRCVRHFVHSIYSRRLYLILSTSSSMCIKPIFALNWYYSFLHGHQQKNSTSRKKRRKKMKVMVYDLIYQDESMSNSQC